MEGYSRIKDGNERLALGEDEVRRICKECFEDLYDIDIQEKVLVIYVASMVFREETNLEES